MAKIMLVEDDTNLSEIYQARLAAEGYQIVSAHDGEEALALAAKEKPDLIISDVMMPKISGFEMLDILRNTDGLKTTKVIMLTALGQAEDKTRAEGLGADRYLVKSQVTLEDIVKAAQELLEGPAPAPAAAPAPTAAIPAPAPTAPNPAPVPPATTAAAPQLAPTPTLPVATPPPVPAATTSISTPVAAAPPSAPVASTPPPVAPLPVAAAPTTSQTATAPTPALPIAQPAPTPTPPVNPPDQPQPTAAPAVEPADPTAAADNKLVTDAVEDLLEGVASMPTANSQPQAAPAATSSPPAPAVTPAPPKEASTPETTPAPASESAQTADIAAQNDTPGETSDNPSNDNVAVAHKKIITPIDDPTLKKPDLNSLLAAEENKNPGTVSQPAVTGDATGQATAKLATPAPHQPGHVISPDAMTATNPSGSGVDPNSIAL